MFRYEFLTGEDVLPEKEVLEKVAIIKRFKYSPLRRQLEKQNGIAKDQCESFKDKMNAFNNKNRNGDIKKGDVEIEDVVHSYIGNEY